MKQLVFCLVIAVVLGGVLALEQAYGDTPYIVTSYQLICGETISTVEECYDTFGTKGCPPCAHRGAAVNPGLLLCVSLLVSPLSLMMFQELKDTPDRNGKRMVNPETCGKLIMEGRERKSWTQKNLADVVGVTSSYISKLEQDDNPPSDQLCVKIARVLELDEKELRLLALEKRASLDLPSLLPSGPESSTPRWNKETQKFLKAFSKLNPTWKKMITELVLRATEHTFTQAEKSSSLNNFPSASP